MTRLATTSEVAKAVGVSVPRIHSLLVQKRIKGAHKIGSNRGTWVIPVSEDGMPEILPAANRPRAFDKINC